MKAAVWKRQIQPLLVGNPEWKFQGAFCYRAPVVHVAYGVLAESSSYDTGTYLWRVFTPLFHALDHLDLSFSKRLDPGRFYEGDNTLTSAVQTVLTSMAATDDAAKLEHIAKYDGVFKGNIQTAESAGYARYLLGRRKTALLALRRVADYESDRPEMWDASERAQTILDLDSSSGEDAVKATLHQWSRDGAARLNLVDRSEKAQP
ncbi:hypothetical protein [Actinokineospora diospyrosa]|uniref:Uncharacterized protein n=1 Tax=Actinokineospora diospyrosa TaxID=103728 RepID=A0ABT1IMG4_9PSEU|nr:hypothetical protein [Actinokineospora diospyrosa]MCP2273724.1 hypothetical protein [Actinokineospora diospyrosa]